MTCASRRAEWRFVKVDGGKTITLRPAAVILAAGLKWKAARVTTQDGTEVFRFDAVTSRGGAAAGRLHRRDRRQQASVPRHRRRGARGEAAITEGSMARFIAAMDRRQGDTAIRAEPNAGRHARCNLRRDGMLVERARRFFRR